MTPRLTRVQLRNFGLLVGGLFAIWFGALIPVLRHSHPALWPWIVGAILIASALLAPQLLDFPYRGWTLLGKALGWVNSRIILNLMFFLIFAPASLIARACGWDPLDREFDPAALSYRTPMMPLATNDLEKPY